MPYSEFDLKTAIETFSLVEERDVDLFATVPSVVPSPSLAGWLEEFAPIAVGINTGKARSEFIIAP